MAINGSAMDIDGSPGHRRPNGNGVAQLQKMDFVTLGMFIIDEIHFPPPTPPVQDILGGAGSFSALGARVFSPPPLSSAVGWIVDCGTDFPRSLRRTIADWQTTCMLRESSERLTTRGWNGYGENDFRSFRYLTPKKRLEAIDLSPALLRSRSFHLICSPARCIEQVDGLITRRDRECHVEGLVRPIFLWEPVPDLCTPSELAMCRQALRKVEVVSPNHTEIAAFFGLQAERGDRVDREVVEKCAAEWLGSGVGLESGPGAVVVRAGREGCYIATRKHSKWIPAYHQSQERVKDPTGGGNAFIGGLAVALARDKSLLEAAVWASIAAGLAIEQVGMPTRTVGPDGRERWNGSRIIDRLDHYLRVLS